MEPNLLTLGFPAFTFLIRANQKQISCLSLMNDLEKCNDSLHRGTQSHGSLPSPHQDIENQEKMWLSCTDLNANCVKIGPGNG